MIYFIQQGKGPIKIGYAKDSEMVRSLVGLMESYNPHKLRLLLAIEGTEADLSEIHTRFSFCRVSKYKQGWFRPYLRLTEFIDERIKNDIIQQRHLQRFSMPRELARIERQTIKDAIKTSGSNIAEMCNLLGMTDRVIRYRLQKYKLNTYFIKHKRDKPEAIKIINE